MIQKPEPEPTPIRSNPSLGNNMMSNRQQQQQHPQQQDGAPIQPGGFTAENVQKALDSLIQNPDLLRSLKAVSGQMGPGGAAGATASTKSSGSGQNNSSQSYGGNNTGGGAGGGYDPYGNY